MLRVSGGNGVQTERVERVSRGSEEKESEEEERRKGERWHFHAAESPVEPMKTTTIRVSESLNDSLKVERKQEAKSRTLLFHSLRLPRILDAVHILPHEGRRQARDGW